MDKDINQILANFGPINGNVEKQEIHMAPEETNSGRQTPKDTTDNKTEKEKKGEQLSIGQILIFFEATLNITFDVNYTNQSKLARLIAQITGYREGSVRQHIRQGISYEDRRTKDDAQVVAALLDDIRPDLAEKIRNNAAE
jgi:hypothetical protein